MTQVFPRFAFAHGPNCGVMDLTRTIRKRTPATGRLWSCGRCLRRKVSLLSSRQRTSATWPRSPPSPTSRLQLRITGSAAEAAR